MKNTSRVKFIVKDNLKELEKEVNSFMRKGSYDKIIYTKYIGSVEDHFIIMIVYLMKISKKIKEAK